MFDPTRLSFVFLIVLACSAALLGLPGRGWRGRLADRLLRTLFPHADICKIVDGKRVVYLRRYFVRHSSRTHGGIYVHHIRRSDNDRDPHDHPWPYISIILAGRYLEEEWKRAEGIWPWLVSIKEHGVGQALRRPATWLHRLQIPKHKTCWSLVITGPRKRRWGFWTRDGWVEQHAYKQANALSDDSNTYTMEN